MDYVCKECGNTGFEILHVGCLPPKPPPVCDDLPMARIYNEVSKAGIVGRVGAWIQAQIEEPAEYIKNHQQYLAFLLWLQEDEPNRTQESHTKARPCEKCRRGHEVRGGWERAAEGHSGARKPGSWIKPAEKKPDLF